MTDNEDEWMIACLDRLCVNCWCGESLVHEQDGDTANRKGNRAMTDNPT